MSKHTIELFYGLTCPHCRTLKKILKEILPEFDERFELKSAKLGIHSVPVLAIDDKIIFRSLPEKEELINKLKEWN